MCASKPSSFCDRSRNTPGWGLCWRRLQPGYARLTLTVASMTHLLEFEKWPFGQPSSWHACNHERELQQHANVLSTKGEFRIAIACKSRIRLQHLMSFAFACTDASRTLQLQSMIMQAPMVTTKLFTNDDTSSPKTYIQVYSWHMLPAVSRYLDRPVG